MTTQLDKITPAAMPTITINMRADKATHTAFLGFEPISGNWDAGHAGPDDFDTFTAIASIEDAIAAIFGEPCKVTVYDSRGHESQSASHGQFLATRR